MSKVKVIVCYLRWNCNIILQPILMLSVATAVSGCGHTGKWKASDFYEDANVIRLIEASENGDLKEIDRLIAAGVDVNARGKDGMTPLLFSMWAKNKSGFKRLLEKGADPNLQLDDGESVTSYSAMAANDSAWLEMALQHGANPNLLNSKADFTGLKTHHNRTPVFGVSRGARMESLEMLIKAGANLNHQDANGTTAAMCAVSSGWYEGALRMVEAGAEVNVKNNEGIDLAAECFFTEVNPQFKASFETREKLLALLAKKGVDLEAAKKRVSQ